MAKQVDSTNIGTLLEALITKIKSFFWRKDETSQLPIDNTPTFGSNNLVKSGGVYSSLQGIRQLRVLSLGNFYPQVGSVTLGTKSETASALNITEAQVDSLINGEYDYIEFGVGYMLQFGGYKISLAPPTLSGYMCFGIDAHSIGMPFFLTFQKRNNTDVYSYGYNPIGIKDVTVGGESVVDSSQGGVAVIPAIPDVSQFITRSVNDLANYYLKSETYTQTEVNNLIGAIQQFHYEIAASTSAVTDPSNNVLYLIGPTGSGADKYEEYVYDATKPVAERWVKIGDTSIDLSNYVTLDALNDALADTVAGLATVARSGSYNDLLNKPDIPADKVFIAEVDVTPYADVLAAVNDNSKVVFCQFLGLMIPYISKDNDGTIHFGVVVEKQDEHAGVAEYMSYIFWVDDDFGWNYAIGRRKPFLDTTSETALPTKASESLMQTVKLHKVSKTGNYNDLLNKPTIPPADYVAMIDLTSSTDESGNVKQSAAIVSGTFAEIEAALLAQKTVLLIGRCPDSNPVSYRYFRSGEHMPGSNVFFASIGADMIPGAVNVAVWYHGDSAGPERVEMYDGTGIMDAFPMGDGNAVTSIERHNLFPALIANKDKTFVDTAQQTLTDAQKSQARTNIGAGTYSKPDGGIPETDIAEDVIPSTYAGSPTAGGFANKAVAIPFGEVVEGSTDTALLATVDNFPDTLTDGVCAYVRNNMVSSASGFTLNINGTGAKPVYQTLADAGRVTTVFNAASTYLFIYNSTRVEGGCWDLYYGYNSNDNTIGYNLRTNGASAPPAAQKYYRYRLLFTAANNQSLVPANTSSSTNATAAKTVNQTKIDPFGVIFYYSYTSAVNAAASPSATYLWMQYNGIALGYSFNRTGEALEMTARDPVYLKCAPQSDGSAIIDADNPIVQALPTTADGKIYIFLGFAESATAITLYYWHPVYYHDGTRVTNWPGVSVEDIKSSIGDIQTALDAIIGIDLPTFTITRNGVTTQYYFEAGMTWGEWVASEYNTDGYSVNGYQIQIGGSGFVAHDRGFPEDVIKTEGINASEDYVYV